MIDFNKNSIVAEVNGISQKKFSHKNESVSFKTLEGIT